MNYKLLFQIAIYFAWGSKEQRSGLYNCLSFSLHSSQSHREADTDMFFSHYTIKNLVCFCLLLFNTSILSWLISFVSFFLPSFSVFILADVLLLTALNDPLNTDRFIWLVCLQRPATNIQNDHVPEIEILSQHYSGIVIRSKCLAGNVTCFSWDSYR